MLDDATTHPVTLDPVLNHELVDRWGGGVGMEDFTEYLYSLGLYPPHWHPENDYRTELLFTDESDDPTLIWARGELPDGIG